MLSLLHVGCGGMSPTWLEPAAKHPDLKIIGLADLNLEAAQRRQAEFAPDAAIGTDPTELIERLRPDIVVNCTVPEAHFEISRYALKSGAHVLSEKPLASSLAQAMELVGLTGKNDRLFAVAQNYRYTAAARTVHGVLSSGVIGELTTVSCDFAIGVHMGGFREQMEHVLLLDMSIHHFDLARFFAGGIPARVYCEEWNPAGSWFKHGANAHAIFRFTNNIVFTYRGSWCAEGVTTGWNGWWRFTGTKGTLLWNEEEIRLETVAGTGKFLSELDRQEVKVQPHPGKDDGHSSLISEFVQSIYSRLQPETHGEDNLHSLSMVFGAIASAESNQPFTYAR